MIIGLIISGASMLLYSEIQMFKCYKLMEDFKTKTGFSGDAGAPDSFDVWLYC